LRTINGALKRGCYTAFNSNVVTDY